MKYNIRQTSRYKKSLKLMLKRGKDIKKITKVVRIALRMLSFISVFPHHGFNAVSGTT